MKNELTVSKCRELARESHAKCDWKTAKMYYKIAIEKYPHLLGELAKLDLQSLKNDFEEMETMIRIEKRRF